MDCTFFRSIFFSKCCAGLLLQSSAYQVPNIHGILKKRSQGKYIDMVVCTVPYRTNTQYKRNSPTNKQTARKEEKKIQKKKAQEILTPQQFTTNWTPRPSIPTNQVPLNPPEWPSSLRTRGLRGSRFSSSSSSCVRSFFFPA